MQFFLFVTVSNVCVTGTSKGYGLVEFTCDRQESEAIRRKLERKSVYDSILHCAFVKETITDFDQLNSTCLYVGNLPSEFNDDNQLREAFHIVAEPLFCCVCSQKTLLLITEIATLNVEFVSRRVLL